MLVQAEDRRVTIRTPAKLNLFFEVLGKRNDGYHEIETLMAAVDRYDTLTFEEEPDGQVTLDARWVGPQEAAAEQVALWPEPGANLAVKAVELLRRRLGHSRGIRVTLAKTIPAAAGLGGASSDAAAALVGANRLWRLNLAVEELARFAAELGSDVPFFLGGGYAVCHGRGERIEPLALPSRLHAVVVRPPEGLSTAAVYGACHVPETPRNVQPLVAALASGDRRAIRAAMFNRLEEPAARLSPWIERLRRLFEQSDCEAWQMTGSGSSYFGLCRSARHAQGVAARFRSFGVGIVMAVADARAEASSAAVPRMDTTRTKL